MGNKAFYEAMKSVGRRKKTRGLGMKKSKNEIVTDVKGILDIWTNFYKELYDCLDTEQNSKQVYQNEPDIPEILKEIK